MHRKARQAPAAEAATAADERAKPLNPSAVAPSFNKAVPSKPFPSQYPQTSKGQTTSSVHAGNSEPRPACSASGPDTGSLQMVNSDALDIDATNSRASLIAKASQQVGASACEEIGGSVMHNTAMPLTRLPSPTKDKMDQPRAPVRKSSFGTAPRWKESTMASKHVRSQKHAHETVPKDIEQSKASATVPPGRVSEGSLRREATPVVGRRKDDEIATEGATQASHDGIQVPSPMETFCAQHSPQVAAKAAVEQPEEFAASATQGAPDDADGGLPSTEDALNHNLCPKYERHIRQRAQTDSAVIRGKPLPTETEKKWYYRERHHAFLLPNPRRRSSHRVAHTQCNGSENPEFAHHCCTARPSPRPLPDKEDKSLQSTPEREVDHEGHRASKAQLKDCPDPKRGERTVDGAMPNFTAGQAINEQLQDELHDSSSEADDASSASNACSYRNSSSAACSNPTSNDAQPDSHRSSPRSLLPPGRDCVKRLSEVIGQFSAPCDTDGTKAISESMAAATVINAIPASYGTEVDKNDLTKNADSLLDVACPCQTSVCLNSPSLTRHSEAIRKCSKEASSSAGTPGRQAELKSKSSPTCQAVPAVQDFVGIDLATPVKTQTAVASSSVPQLWGAVDRSVFESTEVRRNAQDGCGQPSECVLRSRSETGMATPEPPLIWIPSPAPVFPSQAADPARAPASLALHTVRSAPCTPRVLYPALQQAASAVPLTSLWQHAGVESSLARSPRRWSPPSTMCATTQVEVDPAVSSLTKSLSPTWLHVPFGNITFRKSAEDRSFPAPMLTLSAGPQRTHSVPCSPRGNSWVSDPVVSLASPRQPAGAETASGGTCIPKRSLSPTKMYVPSPALAAWTFVALGRERYGEEANQQLGPDGTGFVQATAGLQRTSSVSCIHRALSPTLKEWRCGTARAESLAGNPLLVQRVARVCAVSVPPPHRSLNISSSPRTPRGSPLLPRQVVPDVADAILYHSKRVADASGTNSPWRLQSSSTPATPASNRVQHCISSEFAAASGMKVTRRPVSPASPVTAAFNWVKL
eukprot:TRINITY_DN15201_c0_g1_i2.p1 TRINITY_DN15201_c0_g1~~TRINITY_DN15201_c0_g1_i2.p1  ORF type:complete len:1042 (-),score=133.30 TRINITY_DN15201_c0_g1_i2:72-3197(-)